jgi:hypothetical protein
MKLGNFVTFLLIAVSLCFAACATTKKTEAEHEEETLARTEFTDRVENFFEYTALKAGKPSQFLIHLTDLVDGSPVEKAIVTLTVRKTGGGPTSEIAAKVGRVTGIYVADVTLPEKGNYEIEFRVKNEKLDERFPLKDFEVE